MILSMLYKPKKGDYSRQGAKIAKKFKYLQRQIPSSIRCIVWFDNCLFYFAFLAFLARDCFFRIKTFLLQMTVIVLLIN